MNNEYGLLRLQEENLRLLEEIDRICRKYAISYMLDSGTLLGAVRHKGFIPWDDDVDIAMKRSDWEIFSSVAEKELPADIHLLTPYELAEDNRFYDFTPRITLETSLRKETDDDTEYYHNKLNHLWVDIFIIDNLPDGKLRAWFAKTLQKIIYAMAMGHRRKLDWKKYSPVQKIEVGLFSAIGKLFSMRQICRWQDEAAKKDDAAETGYVYYSNYQPDYLYVTLRKKWIDETEYLDFEDKKYQVPVYAGEILTWVYGDYMKLPDPEKRVPTHGALDIRFE